jgi:hypothetical protein
MPKKKRKGMFTISVHQRNQPEVLPILDHLSETDLGISRTICRLLVDYKNRGYKFDETDNL